MEFPETIQLEIKTKHLIGTDYSIPGECAVSKALKDLYPEVEVYTNTHHTALYSKVPANDFKSRHLVTYGMVYLPQEFDVDLATAAILNQPEQVINTITLTRF